MTSRLLSYLFFFFNDTATTEIYTLSLHDALPICSRKIAPSWVDSPNSANTRSWSSAHRKAATPRKTFCATSARRTRKVIDRKSTRLNSSHGYISYAVFCLKKKKKKNNEHWCIILV